MLKEHPGARIICLDKLTYAGNLETLEEAMKNPDFRITGEEYARPKGRRSERIDQWYNRKRLGIEVCRDFGGDALSGALPEILTDCYEKLMPMFDFFMEVYREEPGSSR